jgi:hypothetical protein
MFSDRQSSAKKYPRRSRFKRAMKCDHTWKASRAPHDFIFHCEVCEFDPRDPTKFRRIVMRRWARYARHTRKIGLIYASPAVPGYDLDSEQGALLGGLDSAGSSAIMLVGGYSFGSISHL